MRKCWKVLSLKKQEIFLVIVIFKDLKIIDWFGWFVGFYGVSTFVGYLTSNPLIVQNISISNYSSSYM